MNVLENRETFCARFGDLPDKDRHSILWMYDAGKTGHRGQKRDTGERYWEHPRAVALIMLDELKIKEPALIISCLGHDLLEDTSLFGNPIFSTYSEFKNMAFLRMEKMFGETVANMIITLSKPRIDKVEILDKEQSNQIYFERLKESSADTILVKMCDRLHNLRSLEGNTVEKQKRISEETVNHYFSIFEKVKEEYPKEYDYLINEMGKEIRKYID